MPKHLKKISLKITGVLVIFLAILFGNLLLQDLSILLAKTANPCTNMDPFRTNISCLMQPGQLRAFYMHLSGPLFVFLSSLLLKSSKHNFVLITFFIIFWIVISESVVQILTIPTLYKGLISGEFSVSNTLFLLNSATTGMVVIFTVITGYMAGVLSIPFKKFLYKSHNS